MARGAHVATVNLEQDHVMENLRKRKGCRKCFFVNCMILELGMGSRTVLISQNDINQILSQKPDRETPIN